MSCIISTDTPHVILLSYFEFAALIFKFVYFLLVVCNDKCMNFCQQLNIVQHCLAFIFT